MADETLTPAQYLALEEKQLQYFLTAVRPVGEEKSELYPEPQYFNTSFISVAALLPAVLDKICERTQDAAGYGRTCRRVLSSATALHLSGLAFIATWGREMWLLDEPSADRRSGLIGPGVAASLSDGDTARILQFSYQAVSHYRRDGQAYPNPTGALGSDYRILTDEEAEAIAGRASAIDQNGAAAVLRLLASVRALSFLMEGETREALMMHGPYALRGGDQLVVFECSDLHWSLFPNFPIPDGARWSLPPKPFPVANIAIALILKDTAVTADRFGTLYIDPLTAAQVVAAALLTRGKDAYRDEGLTNLQVDDARDLGRLCDDIQEHMFLQIAAWSLRQRMAAGVLQEHMLLLRMLSAAGYNRAQIESEQRRIFSASAPIIERYFDKSLARSVDQLPFYGKLNAFAGGVSNSLFTPLGTAQ